MGEQFMFEEQNLEGFSHFLRPSSRLLLINLLQLAVVSLWDKALNPKKIGSKIKVNLILLILLKQH